MGQPVIEFGPTINWNRASASDGDGIHEVGAGRVHMTDFSKGWGF